MNKLYKFKKYIQKKITQNASFESLYNSGIDFYGKQEYERAIDYFKLATEHKDVKAQAYYNLALSYQCTKQYDRAIVTYNKFLELVPNDHDGLYNIALTYYLKENFTNAIEFFEKCVAIKKDEDGVKALTMAYLGANEMQKAIDFANEIFDIPEKGAKLYYEIAKVFENKNSLNTDFTFLDKAIEMYNRLIEKDPKNFDVYLSISICYAKKGEWEASVDFCKKAIETNPKSYEANNQMGLVYYCCNELQEAINYYEKALGLKPEGDYKIYSNLGYAYEKIGQIDKAVKLFTQLVNKFPNIPAKDEIKNHLRILKNL